MKESKNREHIKLIIAFILFFALFGVFLTQFDLNLTKRTTTEMLLLHYDTAVKNNQSACFSYQLRSGESYDEYLEVEINKIQYEKKEIAVDPSIKFSEVICVPESFLSSSDNIVDVIFGSQDLFFHVVKVNQDPLNATSSAINTLGSSNSTVSFEFRNGEDKGISVLFSLFVDGKLDHSFREEVSPKEVRTFSEPHRLQGDNVKVRLATPFETEFTEHPEPSLLTMFLVSLLSLILPGLLICSKFFKFREFSGFLALSVAASIVITVFVSWVLNFLGMTSILSNVLILITLILLVYPRQFNFPKGDNKVLGLIALFVLFSIASQFAMPSHDSMWSVYYERQVDAVYYNGGIPQQDTLSYLGRPFTFTPGYMLLRASFSWLSSTIPEQSFFVFQVLGNVFFASSVIFLCKKLNLKLTESAIVLMFLYSSAFIFGWAIVSLLHLFGFSLLLLSLALVLGEDKHPIASVILLGFASIFHASFLFGYPLLLFALMKDVKWGRIIAYTLLGGLIFLALYSFVILNFGLPTEIEQKNWGYFITGSVIDLGTNSVGLMSLAVLPALLFGFKKERKLVLLSLILIVIFLFVTYRVNIFLSVIVAMLFVRVFNSKQMLALFLLFVASALVNYQIYQGLIGAEKLDPFTYIDLNTKLDSKLLLEPLYGHTSNYFAKRESLADLYVEYASDEKYIDEVNFIASWDKGGDLSILNKWNITYVINEKRSRAIAVNTYIMPRKEITFANLDKVYDNGFIDIHYYRTNNR